MPENRQIIYAGSVNAGSGASVSGKGSGVYTLCLDETGALSFVSAVSSRNSGIITHERSGFIYAANEEKDFGGINGSGGGVSAYRIREDGTLSFLNSSLSYGSRTSYVTVTESGRYLLASNHGSHSAVTCSYVLNENGLPVLKRGFDDSSLAAFSLNEDGSIGKLTDLKVFTGSGYWCHGGGQSTVHMHCVKTRNGLVYGMSRGSDEIMILSLDEESGKMTLRNRVKTRYGYAPRHAVFHPDLDYLYVVNENYPSVSVFRIDEEKADLEETALVQTMDEAYYREYPLPSFTKPHADENEKNTSPFGDRSAAMPSDIHISADGRHLYVSNRRFAGNASIAVFGVNEDGSLSRKQVYALTGKDPRGFGLSKDGMYLIAGLLDRNLAQVFTLGTDGRITGMRSELDLAAPSSFVF